ncbi:MAG: Rne/Rng family ribonuclease [Cytophagales bacterium]|nr:Rne/Rng family ribonuclease [Cytophagales bacterium]
MSELIVSVNDSDSRIAVLDKGELVEYQVESKNGEFVVGDIFLGTVKKVSNCLNAFFVDVKSEKDGFLHFDDLSANVLAFSSLCDSYLKKNFIKVSNTPYSPLIPDKDKGFSSVVEQLKVDQRLLVQVFKEPIFNKGPRLTTRITLAGKYLVLVPFDDEICVSKKIVDDKLRRAMFTMLKKIKNDLNLNHFGFILRTATENIFNTERDNNKLEKILVDDVISLLERWSTGLKRLEKAKVGDRIIQGDNRIFTIVKDKLSEAFDTIYVDSADMYEELKNEFGNEYFKNKALRLYKSQVNTLFYYKKIDKQLKLLLNKNVKIDNGGYLIIEKTEAMNVIDVNSGLGNVEAEDHEEMVFKINMNAVKEIARQITLRDMGGIISVDFIDMVDQKHRMKVYESMKDILQNDRATCFVLPLSRFNVMQITRQRIRPVLAINNSEQCPMCHGQGVIQPLIQTVDDVEDNLRSFLKTTKSYYLTIYMHPLLVSYLSSGWFSKRFRMGLRYWKSITIKQDCSLEIHNIRVVNSGKVVYSL